MKKLYISLTAFLLLLVGQNLFAQNENILRHDLNYHIDSMSMWGPGEALFIDFDNDLINLAVGPGQEVNPSIHEVIGSDAVGISLDFEMFIFLRSTFSMHGFSGGSVDINYPVQVTLDFPDHQGFDHGELVPIHSTYQVQEGWALNTHFPRAGTIALDLEYGFGIDMGISVNIPLLGGIEFPILPSIQYPNPAEFNDPLPHDSIAIIYLNAETGEYAYPWINETTELPEIRTGVANNGEELAINIPDAFGIGLTAEVTIPYVETESRVEGQCLHAQGQDDWFQLDWNILDFIRFIGNAVGQPVVGQVVNILQGGTICLSSLVGGGISLDSFTDPAASNIFISQDSVCPPWPIGIGDVAVEGSIEYYILRAHVLFTLSLMQEFTFCPEIYATMRLATPLPYIELDTEIAQGGNIQEAIIQNDVSNTITFKVNNDVYLQYPCYGWDSLQIYDITYNITSGFRNHTFNNGRIGVDISAVHINVNIELPNLQDIIGGILPVAKSTIPEMSLPEINGGYPNPEEIFAQAYEVQGYKLDNNNLAKSERERFSFCLPTDCEGGLLDYNNDGLVDFDMDFMGVDREWEVPFPENQYNITHPGTWLRPRPELDIEVSSQNVICYGDNSGVITVTAINSSPDYTWTYSHGVENTHAGPVDEINVHSGYYYVTLTDNWGCTVEGEANVIEANAPLESVIRAEDVLCHGDATGNLYVNAYGGMPPYRFEWHNQNDVIISTEQNPRNVVAGTYLVIITDAVGCVKENSVVVNQPEAPLEIESVEIQHISCNGMLDGAIDITVTGGTPAYSYHWSNGATIQDLHNVGGGTYSVTVTDANGCFVKVSYTINEPDPLVLSIDARDVLCYAENTGSADLTVTGGTEPYAFVWSNGATTEDISNLYAGYYIVTVVDAHNCEEVSMTQIRQPAMPLHGEIRTQDVRCYGEANGACDLIVTGGTSPYYYDWFMENHDVWTSIAISEDIDSLEPALYTVVITDNNGCTTTDTVQIYQSERPLTAAFDLSACNDTLLCYGDANGRLNIVPDGGREPYYYEWSNGMIGYDLTDLQNLSAGTYTVTISDNSDCHVVYEHTIYQPEEFEIRPMDDTTICYGMPITVGVGIVAGGTEPYNISWQDGQSGFSRVPEVLYQPATYNATVTDFHNCVSEEITIRIDVWDSIYMNVRLLTDSVVCPGEKAQFEIEVLGGGPGNKQVYVNGDTLPANYNPIIENDTIFVFTVYDNCNYNSVSIPIQIKTHEVIPINIVPSVEQGCAPLTVSFSDLTPNVGQSYLWTFDEGDYENLSLSRAPEHVFHNSGVYHVKVQVTSPSNCKLYDTIPITVFAIPEADLRADRNNISIAKPIINFTNMTYGGFWYSWNFGDGTFSTEPNPVHTFNMPGEFHVVLTATSLYGCVDTAGVNVVVTNEHSIYAPNAFTPNNDEINETFRIFGVAVNPENYQIIVYDRWGRVQFKSTEITEEWDGRSNGTEFECPEGVYTWRIYYQDMFGIDYEKTGTVMLLR